MYKATTIGLVNGKPTNTKGLIGGREGKTFELETLQTLAHVINSTENLLASRRKDELPINIWLGQIKLLKSA